MILFIFDAFWDFNYFRQFGIGCFRITKIALKNRRIRKSNKERYKSNLTKSITCSIDSCHKSRAATSVLSKINKQLWKLMIRKKIANKIDDSVRRI